MIFHVVGLEVLTAVVFSGMSDMAGGSKGVGESAFSGVGV
jgi:hypothetical protein